MILMPLETGKRTVELSDITELAPGFKGLSPEEYEAIHVFTLLWTLFEAQKLEANACIPKITNKVKALSPNIFEAGWFQEQLEYFSNRYFEDGEPTSHFCHLRLGKHETSVAQVLTGENIDPSDQLIACLTIVYRFRNNFFHGTKWAYGIKDQYANFSQSSHLLKECINRFPSEQ